MSSKRLRKCPVKGTVVCIPLPKGHFAYGVTRGAWDVWLYNFITDRPMFDTGLMQSVRWFQYVSCHDDAVGAETFDVGNIQLSAAEQKKVKCWHRVSLAALENGAPTPYKASDPNRPLWEQDYYITEAELPQYQEFLMFTPKQLLDYLEQNRHRLEVIEVDPAKAIVPPAGAKSVTFDPVSTFEIWLSELEKMELTDRQEIAEEIDAELEKRQDGEVMGGGQVVDEDQHNIAVQNAPGRNKQTLACIRRVLKRLKADPETTDIWEQKPDAEEHIAHPLTAPARGK